VSSGGKLFREGASVSRTVLSADLTSHQWALIGLSASVPPLDTVMAEDYFSVRDPPLNEGKQVSFGPGIYIGFAVAGPKPKDRVAWPVRGWCAEYFRSTAREVRGCGAKNRSLATTRQDRAIQACGRSSGSTEIHRRHGVPSPPCTSRKNFVMTDFEYHILMADNKNTSIRKRNLNATP